MRYEDMTKGEIMDDLIVYEKRNQELEAKIKTINDILDEELNSYRSGRENWTILYRRINEIIQSSEVKENEEN